MRRWLICAILVWTAAQNPARAQQAISSLSLAGGLTDAITGQPAVFIRPSTAYDPNAALVPPDTPRYETFAVATRAVVDVRNINNLVPIALLPDMLIAVSGLQIYGSTDGANFQPRGQLPYPLHWQASAFGTPAGSLLVYLDDGQMWRSTDGGQCSG